MHELDMSGVDPLRHAETLRRIAILRRYVSLTRPSAKQTEAHAVELGMSRSQFYRLAKAWRLHKDPRLIAGGSERGSKRNRVDGVSDEAKAIVADVIDELGADARQADIVRLASEHCGEAYVPSPSRGALWTYVMDARSDGGQHPSLARPEIIVGRIWAKVPSRHGDDIVFPQISLVLELPSRRILGTDLSFDPDAPPRSSRALARALDRFSIDAQAVLIMDEGDAAHLRAEAPTLLAGRPAPVVRPPANLLSKFLGRRVGGMAIIYRPNMASTERLLRSQINSPAEPDIAAQHIERAIKRHNAALEHRNGG